ncbi:MAG: T9SS type A sorting domain-containing protein [bacterium]|nr:T9SS type A sorting domain-containing protein [Candidatus Limimorpha equi]
MKKSILFLICALAFSTLQAQWVDDPTANTRLATASDDAGEIYIATHEASGNTYIQWSDMASNGWGVNLQRFDVNGIPQWGDAGLHVGSHQFSSYSEGYAMDATSDNGVVTCFANYEGECIAMKFDKDGNAVWGEQGISVIDFPAGSYGCSKVELQAGNDGGVWVLVSDTQDLYLRYINADGTLNPTTTISDSGVRCLFALLTPGPDGVVFVTYEKIGSGMWYVDKQIWVAGYATDGGLATPPAQLMASQVFGSTYIHYEISDGMGGGYAYIFHSGIAEAFNTYVFHFDANGVSTISNPNGAMVHTTDPANFYGNPYATVDPVSHDIILVYRQTDSYAQSESRLYMNRITPTGEVLWDEGILIADDNGYEYTDAKIDAYPDGSGFMVSYMNGPYGGTPIEALGFDMDGNQAWRTHINTIQDAKTGAENSSGFHNGQNILVWTNQDDGNIYGQNIDTKGTLGPIAPATCYPPTNLEGEYFWNEENGAFGTMISWETPETQPLSYNLYKDEDAAIINIDGNLTSYFDEVPMGDHTYRLTAVYEDCESEYALTPDGADHITVTVTAVNENAMSASFFQNGNSLIVNADNLSQVEIISITGQSIKTVKANGNAAEINISGMTKGLYIVRMNDANGNVTVKKTVIR